MDLIEVPFDFANVALIHDQKSKTFSAGNILNKIISLSEYLSTQLVENQGKLNITQKMNGNNSLVINVGSNTKTLNIIVEIMISNYSTYFWHIHG